MYLKQLDILGFKSFANKTMIRFSPGITAIVGPNGCGKTNILDALRWVLGEQRTSLLRGSKMEEVIFNGTTDVKPLGMAEVTLSLVNNRGILPTEYGEVQVTRRLFRSGESEYLLNKVPCRLKDITELFYDTGVGAHSYAVIQQDMIEAVISDKAEERRFLFEEAAGITKYKQRRKAAQRKLESTEQDLLRLKDIFAEVQTQVRSLKRQYKKAERYQKIINDIKSWELYLNARRISTMRQERRENQAQLDQLTDQIIEKDASIEKFTAQLEGVRKQQVDIEQDLSNVSNEVYEISEKAHTYEKEISVLTEKRSNARHLCERNEIDINSMQQRITILREQQAETETLLTQQKVSLADLTNQLTEAESIQAEADRRLLEARSAREQENQQLLELEGKLSSGKAEEDTLKEQEQELSERITVLQNQINQNNQNRETLQTDLTQKRQKVEELKEQKKNTETRLEQVTQKLESLIEQADTKSVEISELTASIEACQARKTLLEEMILQYEGYEAGVVATMENQSAWSGIAGTVAEKFVPAEGMETATEAALGEMSGFIICDNRNTAEEIIRYLKAEKKGKIGILVPDSGTINPAVKRPELSMPEFIGWLDSFVTTDEHLRPLMEAVLSRTAVFKSDTNPSEILEHLPYGFTAVSTDGVVYSKNVISGGSDEKFPLFRRKEKVAEQETLIQQLQAQLDSANKRRDEVTAEIAATRAEINNLSDTVEDLSEQLQHAMLELGNQEHQFHTLSSELTRLQQEHQQASDKLERIRNRQLNLELDFSRLSDKKRTLVDLMSRKGERLSDYEEAATTAISRVSQLQVAVVEERSKVEQTESKLSHTQQLLEEINKTIEAKQAEIVSARTEIETTTEEINRLETELKTVSAQREEIQKQQNVLEGTRSEILDKITAAEAEIKNLRIEREKLNNEKHQLEMTQNTAESEIKTIVERMREEYDVDITDGEFPCPDESLGVGEAAEHLSAQKELLKKYGAVNLLALEEYKTACDREKFLGEQIEDLTTARNDLKATITKINSTARNLFKSTFEEVRKNFQQLFVELFNGGEADISLVNPDDPLESDINIIARPRGKKMLAITMMSGGERALTAISLLFSLYLVKPSPFCILDEIDAPLDDANCRRFLKIIHSFSDRTQFIIITHNKITMEAASNIYGVTMQQPGISQLVAVKFVEDEPDKVTVAVENDNFDEQEEPLPEAIRKRIDSPLPSAGNPDNIE